jgi:hypothetical protein
MSSIPQVFAGLFRTPVLEKDGTLSWQWQKGFTQLTQAVNSPALSGEIPTSATSTGSAGQIATDGTSLFVCIATDQWVKFASVPF